MCIGIKNLTLQKTIMENEVMANINNRRLPAGIQSFKVIREEGYLYVDKTDIVWKLVNEGNKFNYLSRPRRFGKSILIDTLQMYLEGRKDLFEGLKIRQLELKWTKHPVVHLDMSLAGSTPQTIESYLSETFQEYEAAYGITPLSTASLAVRFRRIVTTAYKNTGNKVAVLIDEYDSPLQHSWKTSQHDDCTAVYRDVFAVLKACDEYEKLVFITGVTKFTQISLFSVLNNLTNISFLPEYAAICGVTEKEIKENFRPELERMAEANGWTLQQTHDKLKDYYDGYHFSRRNMVDIYNPYSFINALNTQELGNYWAASGATSLIPKFVDNMELRLKNFERCFMMRNTLETSDVTGGGAELFLYQSGYLTIKDSDEFGYTLGFPNEEVRQALYNMVLPALAMRSESDVQSLQACLFRQMGMGQVDEAMKSLKADKRQVVGLGIELDENGKGILGWKEASSEEAR